MNIKPKDYKYHISAALLAEVGSQSKRHVANDISILIDDIKSKFGESLNAIVLYGSCLRTLDFREGVVDLYVIVGSYKKAYREKHLRILNGFLPPNVFYMEAGSEDNMIRAKYAVISLNDLKVGIEKWFHSYLWSRFAQPVRMLYTSDSDVENHLYHLFAEAVIIYLRKTIPALEKGRYDSEKIWINALTLSYAAELRPEKQSRSESITHQSMADLTRLTEAAAPALMNLLEPLDNGCYRINTNSRKQKGYRWSWRLRRWQGRILSIGRLMKAAFTFKNAVNYAAWKIKRHTGITIEVTPVLQRHPILFGFNILWRLLRRDALH